MPVNRYFSGNGDKVMGNMEKEYGAKKGKSVFYATANKRGATPAGGKSGGKSKRSGAPKSFGFGK